MFKRAFDFFVSGISLIVLFPLFLVLALLIKLDSPGEIIFKQKRVGQNGKLFSLYKFRTMEHGKENLNLITNAKDNRITRFGKLLRAYSLDELPQFFNIFMRDMSLVGPRPEIPEMVKHYPEKWERVLKAKPGLTGLAQIEYGDEDIKENVDNIEKFYIDVVLPKKLDIDLKYVRKQSFLLDVEIISRTIFKLIG